MPESGLAIDKIGQDPSKRDCARIKMHINRMTSTEIDQLKVVTIGGIVKVTKQYVSLEGNGLIVELTAKPSTRFYLHHDKYGDSNEVDLNLEGNREYRISAELNLLYPIFVNSDVIGAEVYIDGNYTGRTNENFTLTVKDIAPGKHTLKIQHGSAVAEQDIEVNSDNLDFRLNVNSVKSIPQYVVFEVTPKSAEVIIEQRRHTPDAYGIVETPLNNGTYTYEVSAAGYHTKRGTVTVNGKKVVERVVLDRAHGWVYVESTTALQGADVYIDGNLIGKVPVKSGNLASGEHSIKIVKNLYHPYEATITIKDNETLKYTPSLSANFATVTLSTANGAGIYVNDKYKGTTTWTGDLETGLYIFEARKERHRTTTISKEISAKPQKQNITLESPTPITGYLNLTTSPTMASVKIDDKEIGESPLMEELLIGSHTVSASKKGYKVAKTTVTIKEGETTALPITLQEDIEPAKLHISSLPGKADVYIDNTYVGETDTYKYVEAGTHKIKIKKSRYKKYTEKLTLAGGDIKTVYARLEPTLLTQCTDFFSFGLTSGIGLGGAHLYTDEAQVAGEFSLGVAMRMGKPKMKLNVITGFEGILCDNTSRFAVPAILHVAMLDQESYFGIGTEFIFPFNRLNQPAYSGVRLPLILQLGGGDEDCDICWYFKGGEYKIIGLKFIGFF